MTISDWIAIAGLIIVWIGSLITFWIQIKIKIAELDIRINNCKDDLMTHIRWDENIQAQNERKIHLIETENKEYNKEMNMKLDKILERLNDFMIYVEQKIK